MPYRVMRYEAADKFEIPVGLPRVAQTLIPVSLTPPVIFGVGQVGQTLTAYPGTWLNTPTFTYQWFRGNLSTSITSLSASPSYTPITADIANFLYVGVTATNLFGSVTVYNSIPSVYSLYETNLESSFMSLLYTLTAQQINHARQSPAANMIAFTTYNNYTGSPPLANENGGATNTEIRILNPASGVAKSAIPPNALYENAWPSWLGDGSGFNYKTTFGTTGGKEGIAQYILATGLSTLIYNPGDISISSSHVNAIGNIVMAGTTTVSSGFESFLYILSSGVRTQLTTDPPFQTGFVLGDVAPSWSPDNTKVAALRQLSPGIFHILVVAVGVGPSFTNISETVITPPGSAAAFDGIPEWASDGGSDLLITYYTDPANTAANGIYTLHADGSNRQRVNLLANFADTLTSFIPGGGNSQNARIVYSAQTLPIFGALPANTVLPAITGAATVGNTLAGHAGTWINGATLTYQWARGGMPVAGQTTLASYMVTSADIGFTITLIETATSTSGAGYVSATSNPTAVVGGDSLNLGLRLTADSMPLAA